MENLQESFVYLWYDSNNKKFYLGKHKGTPDDGYTHSSTVWERFTANEIPKGVRRRILAYGTDPEICKLEHKLLKNRKKRCWHRYYNTGLGDPRYIDQWGPNNHMYGKKLTEEEKEAKSQWMKNEWATRRKGWKPTPEMNKRNSETKKRMYASGELVHPMLGKKLSKDTIAKIQETRKKNGFCHTEETKKKMSETRSGSGNANWKGGLSNDPEHKKRKRQERMKDPVKRAESNKKHREYMNKKKGWTKERYKQLSDLYNLNLSNDQIAEKMGITRQAVVAQLKHNIKPIKTNIFDSLFDIDND